MRFTISENFLNSYHWLDLLCDISLSLSITTFRLFTLGTDWKAVYWYNLSTKIKWLNDILTEGSPWPKFLVAVHYCLENIQKVHTVCHHYLPGFIRMSDSHRVIWNVDHVCIFYFIYRMTSNICHFSSFCY